MLDILLIHLIYDKIYHWHDQKLAEETYDWTYRPP